MRQRAKRLQKCWPASIHRRQDFLPPTKYTHRTGRTAKHLLHRAVKRLASMLHDAQQLRTSIWEVQSTTIYLPAHPEDLLICLVHEQGLGLRRRGHRVTDLPDLYSVPIDEVARALATFTIELAKAPRTGHTVTAEDALAAAREAHYNLEASPVVPS